MRRAAVVATLTVLGLAVVLPASGGRASGPYTRYLPPAGACPGAEDPARVDGTALRTMSCVLNYARRQDGLSPLRLDQRLNKAARLKVEDNVRCDEFSHTACGTPFNAVFRRSGYLDGARSYQIGENLAWGSFALGSPRSIVEAWLNSPGHRENLFRTTWREMGLAVVRPPTFLGEQQVALWANEFGARD
jgi:uncharacterized protein YkwD